MFQTTNIHQPVLHSFKGRFTPAPVPFPTWDHSRPPPAGPGRRPRSPSRPWRGSGSSAAPGSDPAACRASRPAPDPPLEPQTSDRFWVDEVVWHGPNNSGGVLEQENLVTFTLNGIVCHNFLWNEMD